MEQSKKIHVQTPFLLKRERAEKRTVMYRLWHVLPLTARPKQWVQS